MNPRPLLPVFTLLALGGPASAQSTSTQGSLTLTAALAQSARQPSVTSARAALTTAQADLAKAKADPLGTKVTLLRAQQAYDLALATLRSADAQADSQIVSAYTQVLEAQEAVRLARASLNLAQKSAQVAQTQYQKGGGTEISVQVAQNGVQAAAQGVQVAGDSLALATSNLRSLVGPFTTVAPIPANALPPGVNAGTVEEVLGRTPALVQARQAVAALQLQVNLLDPLAASASQISATNTQFQQAQAAASNAERALRLQTQGLYNAYVQATKNRSVKAAALQNAQRQLSADQTRYQKGLISGLALLQSQLAAGQAGLGSEQASDAVLTTYYALLAGPSGR